MASPVTVIANPLDSNYHLLFWLNGTRQQLALEQRPLEEGQQYQAYQDYGISQGVIVNPSSLATVMHGNLVTVYGITQPGVSDQLFHVSRLSPIYNLISDDPGAITTQPALAACADSAGHDFVYYLQLPPGGSTFQLIEFEMVNDTGKPNPPFLGATPSKDTNLAAVYFKATKERFVFFSNTDKRHYLFWVNSTNQDQSRIEGTSGVNQSSPLAACSIEETGPQGSTLMIFLYYMDINQNLNRIVGTATGSSINWNRNVVVTGAPFLKPTTLMAVATTGKENYVYYKPDGQDTFTPFIDKISPDMFLPPPEGERRAERD